MKWIKHDTDANQDAKLQNVLLDYGLEGYGLYWYCIELIAGKVDKDNITFELEHDARIIARNVGSTAQKVEEIMRYFVKTGLFEDANGVITCLKIARRLDQSMTSNKQMREIIDKLKNHDLVMIESGKPMQDEIRLEEIRLKELGNKLPDDTPKKSPSKAKGLTEFPDGFEITESMVEWFTEQDFKYIDLGRATDKWVDAMKAKGSRYKDWTAAWRNGMNNAEKWSVPK